MSIPATSDNKRIYLDHAATTPLDSDVLAVMLPYITSVHGNASSLYTSGREAKRVLKNARNTIAEIVGVSSGEVLFTGSGTESDNLAIFGIAEACKEHGKHIVVSAIEHPAVLEPARALRARGFDLTVLPVSKNGIVDPQELKKALRKDTVLVSAQYANNEIGTIQPIKEIAEIIKKHRDETGAKTYFHADACQAAGYLPLHINDLGVDLLTLNGSKIYGPKGIGTLIVKKGTPLSPLIYGGHQEFNKRAGTENVALAIGLATALKKAESLREEESERLIELRDYLIQKIEKHYTNTKINGDAKKRLPSNVHVSFPNIEGESMLLMLDAKGFEVATGSACSSASLAPSHVLLAIEQSLEIIHGSLRITLGRSTTKNDIDAFFEALSETVDQLTRMSALTKSS